MGLALQAAFALLAIFEPGAAVLELTGSFPLAGHGEEHVQGRAGIGDDAQVRGEHAADLGAFDVHMDKATAFGVDIDRAGVAVGPTVTDTQNHVGFEHRRVAVAVRGLQANHADHQRVVVRDGTPAHQGRDDRDAGQFGELHQLVAGIGVDDAATGDQQWAFGGVEQGQGFLDLDAAGRRLLHGQRFVGFDVEFDFSHLHVERQVDQHRARAAGAHFIKGFLEGIWHLARLQHGGCPLGHRLDDAGDVDGLEVFLVHTGARRLAGDAQDRDGVGRGTVQAGDHVGAGRA
ncbi:hypothetical protein D3C76_397780 [compost metagenome]